MAVPIRLLAGPQNDIQMDLVANTIDINIERNISSFPTPNNILKRFAIDTNTPRINIDIHGIIDGDEGLNTQTVSGTTPMRTLLNFGSMLPSTPFSEFKATSQLNKEKSQVGTLVNVKTRDFPKFTLTKRFDKKTTTELTDIVPDGQYASGLYNRPKFWTGSTQLSPVIDTNLKFTGAHSIGATGAFTVETTLSINGSPLSLSSLLGFGADALLNIGDRVVDSSGVFLGIVSATTSTSITFENALTNAIPANEKVKVTPKCFNQRNEFVGFVTKISDDASVPFGGTARWSMNLSAVNDVELKAGDILSVNQSNDGLESSLHKESIKIVPSYWIEDASRNPKGSLVETDVERGISRNANIGIVFRFDANKTPALLGGSDAITVTNKATGVRRSLTFANQCISSDDSGYYDAIVDIPIKGIGTTAGKNPASIMAQLLEDAFELTAEVSTGNMNTAGKTLPDAFRVKRYGSMVVIEHLYVPSKSISHPKILSNGISANFNAEIFQGESSTSTDAKKSAGDKVQDLIGLVSNCHKEIDMFRGVQIPYDSLITSSGVTGVARNFFLTFGDLPASEKGSISNTRSASEPMDKLSLTGEAGHNIDEGGKESWWERVAEGTIAEDAVSLLGFVLNTADDLFVTLLSEGHGNDGGIRIMPEKLHVKYQAGNNYYGFQLTLVATDFVIGV